jgi:outer membrane receptor protein involved in Fe transport
MRRPYERRVPPGSMNMRKTPALIFVCLLVVTTLAAAQVPTGTISGRVVSSDDAPLPGVTVTVTSPNLQGARTVVTTDNGDFVVPLLPPGDYSIVFELSGFQSLKRQIGVAGTQTVILNETMAVGGVEESVNVIGSAAPFVETATVAAKFRQDLMTTLPSNRTLDAAILLGPAVHATGPNGGYSVAGSMSYESLFAVNGVVITENLRGQPFVLYIEDALQETTVATSGISAEFGRFGGGIVNAITKSGSDIFSGSYRQSFHNDDWRSTSPFNEAKLDRVVPTYEYTFGGPIARRQLWFFNAGRFQEQQSSFNTVATSIPYVRTNDEKRYEIKGTYSPMTGHTGRVAYTKISQQITNFSSGNIMDTRSLFNQGQPQDLLSVHYTGVLTSNFSVEGQWAQRKFTFVGSGAPTRDLIEGTLLIDRARGGGNAFRYWSPTFCGVCDNNEERSNTDFIAKASYFLSTRGTGSHHMVFGVDSYNDHRSANNHQSGSDYRILGTSTIVQGQEILPVFLPNSTIIQWNPITLRSQGTDLRTNSIFLNDQWQYNGNVTFNLGVRWDRNQGEDAAGGKVSDSSKWSPRLAVVYDPTGDGVWSASGSFARYVTALNTSLADVSPGGNSSTFQWPYLGPAVNQDPNGPLMTTPQAIQTLFSWFNANGGTSRPFSAVDIPGVSSRIGDSLDSPNVNEWSAGIARQIGGRGSLRADFVYRNYADFYATRTDTTTGRVTDPVAGTFDLTLLENTDVVDRRYKGVTFQATYRLGSRADIGGNYTLSKASGSFDGENLNSGPLTTDLLSFPEFVDARWNSPEGDVSVDQRHRARIWGTYRVPIGDAFGGLDLGVMQTLESGVPYGAVGAINTIPYAPTGLYLNPSGNRADGFWDYYFTGRDEFRTEPNYRTDVSLNYSYRVRGNVQLFFHGEVVNVFNVFQLCGCGSTVFSNGGATRLSAINQGVLTAANSPALRPFNPFIETPVEGVHWAKGGSFGRQVSQQSWTTPRTFRFSFGARF